MRSNTGLRNHLVVQGRIKRFRHVSQGNLADFRKLGREQLHRLDRGDLHFLLQRMCASVQHRGGDGDHRNTQQRGHHQEHAHGQPHAGLLPGMLRGGHGWFHRRWNSDAGCSRFRTVILFITSKIIRPSLIPVQWRTARPPVSNPRIHCPSYQYGLQKITCCVL